MDFLTPDDEQTPDKRQALMDYLTSKYGADQQDAQTFQNDAQLGNALAQAGSRIGAAVGGVKYDPNQAFYDAQNKQAAQPIADVQSERKQAVENYLTGQQLKKDQTAEDEAKAAMDPNSQRAVATRSLLAKAGVKGGTDALGVKDLDPLLTAAEKDRTLSAQDREHADNMAFRRDTLAAQQQTRADAASTKKDKALDDARAKLQKDLEPDAGRAGNFGKVSGQVLQAQRLEALASSVANGNLDQRQIEELAIGANKLISGSSSPASEQVKALVPHSALGDANKLYEWLSNDPTGTGQQAFVHRMLETVQREKATAQHQLQDIQRRRLAAHQWLKENDPQGYKAILDNYNLGEQQPTNAPMGGGVLMEAPDGSRRYVPVMAVKKYEQKGVTIVQ